MTILAAILWGVCIFCETSEHLAYRMAGRAPRHRWGWMALGIGWHVLVLIAWFWWLTLVPLGVAMPLMGASYATTACASRLLFKERVDAQRWLGIAVITVGLALIWRTSG